MIILFEQTTISITIPLAAWVCFIVSIPAMIFAAGCRYGKKHRDE